MFKMKEIVKFILIWVILEDVIVRHMKTSATMILHMQSKMLGVGLGDCVQRMHFQLDKVVISRNLPDYHSKMVHSWK